MFHGCRILSNIIPLAPLLVSSAANGAASITISASELKDLYQQAKALESQPNPVFTVPSKELAPGQLWFAVEIPAGEDRKFELRTATGSVILDRRLCPRPIIGSKETVAPYPVNYGIVPGQFSVDGDPLDMVVFGGDQMFAQQVQKGAIKPTMVRVIGVMKMEECVAAPCKSATGWEKDWKVVATLPTDPRWQAVKDVTTMAKDARERLTLFFSNYKGPLDGHPQTRVTGYLNPEQALRYVQRFKSFSAKRRAAEVKACHQAYEMMLKSIAQKKKAGTDPIFNRCHSRVFWSGWFRDRKSLEFYLNYAAFRILQVARVEGVTFENATAKMGTLKRVGKNYHRFVRYDRPEDPRRKVASRGSGNLILEWVKTKNRNKGCDPSFLPQHYEANRLIDL